MLSFHYHFFILSSPYQATRKAMCRCLWLILTTDLRPALYLARHPFAVTTEWRLLISNFFTLLPPILFTDSPLSFSLACIYFLGLPHFPIITVSLPRFFPSFLLPSLYSPSFFSSSSSFSVYLASCTVHPYRLI